MKGNKSLELNNQLKDARQRKSLTQKQVAEAIHVDTTTYAHYESGRRVPNAKTWVELCKILGLNYFPAQIQIIYPDGLLDKFEQCLVENGTPTENFRENNERFTKIHKVLNEVHEIREEAMDTTDLPINEAPCPSTIMNVALDLRGEKLINKALECMSELMAKNRAMYSE